MNGTLIDIETDAGLEEIYRTIAHFLTYQGISLFIGNDMQRDIFGPQQLNMKTISVSSNQGEKYFQGFNPTISSTNSLNCPRQSTSS